MEMRGDKRKTKNTSFRFLVAVLSVAMTTMTSLLRLVAARQQQRSDGARRLALFQHCTQRPYYIHLLSKGFGNSGGDRRRGRRLRRRSTATFICSTSSRLRAASPSSSPTNDASKSNTAEDSTPVVAKDDNDRERIDNSSEDNNTNKNNSNQKVSSWRNTKHLRRRAGAVLSAIGFLASATRGLLGSSVAASRHWFWRQGQQLQQDEHQHQEQHQTAVVVDALRRFLQTSGIDLELSSALRNVRLLDNIIILTRVERVALQDLDRRDLALLPSPSDGARHVFPYNAEALR
jgi:hypothetical protein